jgi:hypothetical protein
MHDGLSERMVSVVITYTEIQARSSVRLLAAFVCIFQASTFSSGAILLLLLLLYYYMHV